MTEEEVRAEFWEQAEVLNGAGVGYGEFAEQMACLLFLKMTDERQSLDPDETAAPEGYGWQTLLERDGAELEAHYKDLLAALAGESDLLGAIFRKSQNHVRNPAQLKSLISNLIEPVTWSALDADFRGGLYEELLGKNAEKGSAGAGKHFTPRALIEALVDCALPAPGEKIADPGCGTGGFLLAAYSHIAQQHSLNRTQKAFLRDEALRGVEIDDDWGRLGIMNLLLHGIADPKIDATPTVEIRDALLASSSETVDLVLTNPPFERERGQRDEQFSRDEFWCSTSSYALNFLQHAYSMLDIGGRAAVMMPDGVLFESGDAAAVRKRLLESCELHTILRLPPGIFRNKVKANVLFFTRRAASSEAATKELWVYDFRTGQDFTPIQRKMNRRHLDDFVEAYCPGQPLSARTESESFRRYAIEELEARGDHNLDLWTDLASEATRPKRLPAADMLAREIGDHLSEAAATFHELAEQLRQQSAATD